MTSDPPEVGVVIHFNRTLTFSLSPSLSISLSLHPFPLAI